MSKTIKEMTNKELVKLTKELGLKIDLESMSREEVERALEEATAETPTSGDGAGAEVKKKKTTALVGIRWPHMKNKTITAKGGLVSFNADGMAMVPDNADLHAEIAKIAKETVE